MEIVWTHNINTVNTDNLVKYFEIVVYSNTNIRIRYISQQMYQYVEKEQTFSFDIDKIDKFKIIIKSFPKIEILELDIDQFFNFMNILLKNL
jgi:hypothetical protein